MYWLTLYISAQLIFFNEYFFFFTVFPKKVKYSYITITINKKIKQKNNNKTKVKITSVIFYKENNYL